eukprot:GHRQ01033894.1.p1 GENE.GHRQ01033894.1~~GHRQ01033894.1.p1  ORF type:complete len:164 (+),score=56.88 GHRQ01033894.1:514-1005(+)
MGLAVAIDRYFRVTERGSTIGTEVKSGIATFLTMSYILLVNPQILGAAGLPVKAVVTATALSSTLASLLCGLTANLPVGMSPGMGLNAYLVFSQVGSTGHKLAGGQGTATSAPCTPPSHLWRGCSTLAGRGLVQPDTSSSGSSGSSSGSSSSSSKCGGSWSCA